MIRDMQIMQFCLMTDLFNLENKVKIVYLSLYAM